MDRREGRGLAAVRPDADVALDPMGRAEPVARAANGNEHFVRLTRDLGRYGAGMAASKVLMVLTLPVATRLFPPREFGLVELLTSFATIGATICLFGMDSAVEALYFDPWYAARRRALVSTTFGFLLASAVVGVGVTAFFGGALSQAMFGTPQYGSLVVLAAVVAALTALAKFGTYLARMEFKAWAVAVIAFLTGPGSLLVILAITLVWGASVYAWQAGLIVGGAAALTISLYFVRHYLTRHLSPQMLRSMLPIAGLFFASSLVALLATTMERYLLARLVSVEQMGIYAVATRLASYLSLVLGTASLAWGPLALKIYHENDAFEATYRKGLTYYLVGASALGLALTAFAPEIVRVLTVRAYQGAVLAVGGVAIAAVAGSVPMITAVGLILKKRSGVICAIASLALAVNVAISLLLIPRIGILGAALATAMGQIVFAVASYLCTEYLLAPFRFDRRIAITIAVVALAYVAVLSYLTATSGVGQSLPIRALVWASFVPSLILFRCVTRGDLRELKTLTFAAVGRS